MVTRDQLIKEARARGGSVSTLILVYGSIVGTMIATAMAIV